MVKAWEQNGPEFYASLQEEILRQALPLLKPGGMLLYSTCTFSPLEDEGTVEKILEMDADLSLVKMKGYKAFDAGRPELIGSSREEIRACVRIFPHKLDGEGHFAALFQKKGEAVSETCPVFGRGLSGEEKKLFEQFARNLNREFDKSQSLAMALTAGDYKNCLMLSVEDERVVRYLKGETLSLAEDECQGDWQLVCVDGYPLGWGKRTGMTLKNKYHSGWRLL